MRKVNDIVHNYSDIERKTRKATSSKPYGASSQLMNEIASATYYSKEFYLVMNQIFKRFASNAKYWRHIYKSLVLLEYLLKVGSEEVVRYSRNRITEIKGLTHYVLTDKAGLDHGLNIRNKAKIIEELLMDDDKIKAERSRACQALPDPTAIAGPTTALLYQQQPVTHAMASAPGLHSAAHVGGNGEFTENSQAREERMLAEVIERSKRETTMSSRIDPEYERQYDADLKRAIEMSKQDAGNSPGIESGNALFRNAFVSEGQPNAPLAPQDFYIQSSTTAPSAFTAVTASDNMGFKDSSFSHNIVENKIKSINNVFLGNLITLDDSGNQTMASPTTGWGDPASSDDDSDDDDDDFAKKQQKPLFGLNPPKSTLQDDLFTLDSPLRPHKMSQSGNANIGGGLVAGGTHLQTIPMDDGFYDPLSNYNLSTASQGHGSSKSNNGSASKIWDLSPSLVNLDNLNCVAQRPKDVNLRGMQHQSMGKATPNSLHQTNNVYDLNNPNNILFKQQQQQLQQQQQRQMMSQANPPYFDPPQVITMGLPGQNQQQIMVPQAIQYHQAPLQQPQQTVLHPQQTSYPTQMQMQMQMQQQQQQQPYPPYMQSTGAASAASYNPFD